MQARFFCTENCLCGGRLSDDSWIATTNRNDMPRRCGAPYTFPRGWCSAQRIPNLHDCREDAQYLAVKLKAEYGVKEVVIGYVGAVLGTHAGPGAVAVAFFAP